MVMRSIGEVLRILIGAALTVLFARTFLVVGLILPCRVTSDSMEPTVRAGQRMVVDRTAFWLRTPRRWEIVVLNCPHEPRELCVKRIAGLPGERLRIHDGHVLIGGQVQPSPLAIAYGPRAGQEVGDSPEYTLGKGEYFLLGDNSLVSDDSRSWEPPAVRQEAIIGRAIVPTAENTGTKR